VEAANRGGHIDIHHNTPPPLGDLWLNEFRKAFPKITVEATRLPSAEMAQRFGTEYPAGVSKTDAVITLWDETLPKWSAAGWVKSWTPPESAPFAPEYKRDKQFYTLNLVRSAMISHKGRIKDADAPREWADFFNPKWKDKIGINPPWRSVAVQEMLAFWHDQGERDVAKRLKANGVRFFNGSAGIVQAVIRGDVQVAAVIEPPVISAIEDGAPVRIAYPASGVPATATVGFLPAKSPNPEAGMVFLNWAMSMAGQQSFQDIAGAPTVRPGVKPPKLVPGLEGMKIVLTERLLTAQMQTTIIDEWRSVFGLQ
jgi:iron(III) transport system substrate-binding protein